MTIKHYPKAPFPKGDLKRFSETAPYLYTSQEVAMDRIFYL